MVDLRDGASRSYDELGLETPFADSQPWGKPNAESEHFAFDESPFAENEAEAGTEEGEALAWLDLESEEEEAPWRGESDSEDEWLGEEGQCSHCGSRAEQEAEQEWENEAEEFEEEDLEGVGSSGACNARMKFEFQTKNKLHRNDGKKTFQLKRKYGPEDYLAKQDGARLESESDTDGVVEFETEWFRKWPKLEKAIQAAVKMTEEMSAAPASRFDASRKVFPFDVAHLRKATAAERAQGYWNKRPNKENHNEKPLSAAEELEVEVVDPNWSAAIQSSESMLLEHYESLLVQHEDPTLVIDTIQHADALLKIANAGNSAAKNGKLRNFLLIVTNYILRGQRVSVKATYPKANFRLMNRTNFASIYSNLLPSMERQMFASLVSKKLVLKELGLTASTRFFKEGYGEKKHFDGPTVNAWLQGIVGGKDLLAAGQSPGLSASMGRYKVETLASQQDRWHVKFEVRGTVMGRTKASKDWLSYASMLFDLACKREVTAVELLIKQGITDEAALTHFVFHARHAELKGRKIRASETSLVEEWKAIKSKVIQPLLAKPQPELADFGGEHEGWMRGVDETEHYAPDWEQFESSEPYEAFANEEMDEAMFENDESTFEFTQETEDEWLDERLDDFEMPPFGATESGWLNEAPKPPSHSYSGFNATKKQLVAASAARALKSVTIAASYVGSAYGRPEKMSATLRSLLQTHFKTTQRKHLRTILSNLMGIQKALTDGVEFICDGKAAIIGGEVACGWAYNTQWFGGFGGVHISFDKASGSCDFESISFPDTLQLASSQDRLVIHEVGHRYEGLDDHVYGWEPAYAALPTKQALANADSYAVFCVELNLAPSATPSGGARTTGRTSTGATTREHFSEDFDFFDEFEEFGELEDEFAEETMNEQDPSISAWAERIVARETPLFELETKSKWTSCFTATDIEKVKKLYDDNFAAAQAKDVDRASCIVMLNVALGPLLALRVKRHRARGKSNRIVMMANLTTDTIEKAMTQLRRKSYASPPAVLNFFDRRDRTAGTLKPERLKQSVSQYVIDNAAKDCWTAFSLSVMDGYHSVMLLVDQTSSSPKIYWLDQFTQGLGSDVAATLDTRLTQTTQAFWQGVMDSKKLGFNTTIRLWKLRKRSS
jgi:Lysine-specific metallo-endopeptidase